MWISPVDPVNFLELARAWRFAGIQAPGALEQSLPSQNFVQTCDATGELVGCVKKCRVTIGYFRVSLQKTFRNRPAVARVRVAFLQQAHRPLRPNRPVAQQASD